MLLKKSSLSSELINWLICEVFIEPKRLDSYKNNDLKVSMKIGGTQFNQNIGWLTDVKIYGLHSGRFKSNTDLNHFYSPLKIVESNG